MAKSSKPKHHTITVRRRSLSDPLSAALAPRPNESPLQRELRLKAESDARRISERIDEMIRREQIDKKKFSRDQVNVLLLGQSESGKSTTLKQFQLLHSPAAFHAERIAWRTVIYLNLVRSVMRILEAIAPDSDLDDYEDADLEPASIIISRLSRRASSSTINSLIPGYESYLTRLAPLVEFEDRLTRLLSTPNEDDSTSFPPSTVRDFPVSSTRHLSPIRCISEVNGSTRPTPTLFIPPTRHMLSTKSNAPSSNSTSPIVSPGSSSCRSKEVSIHTSINWKKSFALGSKSQSPKSAHSGEIEGWWEDPKDPVHTLSAFVPAMIDLWKDPKVREQLHDKKLRLEESSGFYLNDIPRVTATKYIPTDADILKARLKTTGVMEHSFTVTHGKNKGVSWRVYDVGGSRNQRQAWAPYFEDINAIIFLAPISAFDQVLTEDHNVNRLEDSLLLWRAVVSNKLLANVNIVLFLNKCDLLRIKLEAGVRLNQYLPSYGNRPNDHDSIAKYFRHKFVAIHQSYTPNRERELYIHLTSVTDTRKTAIIISSVRDIIIKRNLSSMKMV